MFIIYTFMLFTDFVSDVEIKTRNKIVKKDENLNSSLSHDI